MFVNIFPGEVWLFSQCAINIRNTVELYSTIIVYKLILYRRVKKNYFENILTGVNYNQPLLTFPNTSGL